MKSIPRGSLLQLLILVVVTGASAIPAHAQAATGSFTLAHKALWGGAVLPPGETTRSPWRPKACRQESMFVKPAVET